MSCEHHCVEVVDDSVGNNVLHSFIQTILHSVLPRESNSKVDTTIDYVDVCDYVLMMIIITFVML